MGRLRHCKMETRNQKILAGRACNLGKTRAPNPSRNPSFLDVVRDRGVGGSYSIVESWVVLKMVLQ